MEDTQKQGIDTRPFRPKKMTLDDIRNGCISLYGADDKETQICVMNEELRQGIDTLAEFPKKITIFGSARTPESDPFYQKAVELAEKMGHMGYGTITGGGPGIMDAGNRGAHHVNAPSIGMTIKLPMEQVTSPFVTTEIPFYFFFTRKTAMRFTSQAFVFFPGGFGTLDELAESLTLVQTEKIDPVPMILVGVEFWTPLVEFFKNQMVAKKMISPEDMNLFTITDDIDQVVQTIIESQKNA